MVNALRGEIAAELDDKNWTLCLTLGALASLEDSLEVNNLAELSEKFSSGQLSASDLLRIIHAGLLGGGHAVNENEVAEMRVKGGINGYAEIAMKLLETTFSPLKK